MYKRQSQTTPKKVNFATGIVPKEIISGHWHTCVVSQTHEMYCWGDGASGKLGDGAGTHNPTPGKVGHFSGTNPVKAHGEVTSWAIHPTLPTGLNLGSNNGTLYGANRIFISNQLHYLCQQLRRLCNCLLQFDSKPSSSIKYQLHS